MNGQRHPIWTGAATHQSVSSVAATPGITIAINSVVRPIGAADPTSQWITPPNAAPTVPENAVSTRQPRKPARKIIPPSAAGGGGAAGSGAAGSGSVASNRLAQPLFSSPTNSPALSAAKPPAVPPSPITTLTASLTQTSIQSPLPNPVVSGASGAGTTGTTGTQPSRVRNC